MLSRLEQVEQVVTPTELCCASRPVPATDLALPLAVTGCIAQEGG
ncbi:MAG: hypothetical protein ACRDYD_10840 [Acidimicrobiales bacterium]